jgi:hypothetical protein
MKHNIIDEKTWLNAEISISGERAGSRIQTMNRLTDTQREAFLRDDFILLRQAIPQETIDLLEQHFLGLVTEYSGKHFSSASSDELADFLAGNRDLEKRLYDTIRNFPWVEEFSSSPVIAAAATFASSAFLSIPMFPMRCGSK